jgi:L-ascorbate metabolism protein UlaG (beta-lactamase superfamily)
MKKSFITFISLLITIVVFSQDIVKTSVGDLKINPVIHGTLVLEINELTIYIDPYGGAEKFASFNSPDLILITDIHGDHLNQKTLDDLDVSNSKFIVPQAVKDQIADEMKSKCQVLNNGEETDFSSIKIKALPMYNLPEEEASRHPKGRGNGYIVTIGDKNIYISGDTEDIPEMRSLKNIDVAFVCMNLPYTMSVDQAADAVNEFKPKVVYPFHYRGSEGLSDVSRFKNLVNSDVEVRLKDWYPQ